jgi:hypothetical protein
MIITLVGEWDNAGEGLSLNNGRSYTHNHTMFLAICNRYHSEPTTSTDITVLTYDYCTGINVFVPALGYCGKLQAGIDSFLVTVCKHPT